MFWLLALYGKEVLSLNRGPAISIVVPVYNTADYIERCVDSLLTQTINVLEIILVDDGSTDESGEVCAALQRQHPQVRYVTQPNGGPASARRRGIQEAVGNHLAFVDSDDVVHPCMYELLYHQMEQQGVDIACCGFLHFSEEETPFSESFSKEDWVPEIFEGTEKFRALLRDRDMMLSQNNKLYPAVLFQNIDFHSGLISHEDLMQNLQLFQKARTVGLCRLPLYGYYVRSGSLSHRPVNLRQMEDVLFVARQFCDMSVGDPELEVLAKSRYNEQVLYCYTQMCRDSDDSMKPLKKELSVYLRKNCREIWRDESFPSIFKWAAAGAVLCPPFYEFLCRRHKNYTYK